MKIKNIALILLASAAITSCSIFDSEENVVYNSANDPLINRPEGTLPLDKELAKIAATETKTSEETPAIAVEPVKIDTKVLSSDLKESLRELNLNQSNTREPAKLDLPKQELLAEISQSDAAQTANAQPIVKVSPIATPASMAKQKTETKTIIEEISDTKPEIKPEASLIATSAPKQSEPLPELPASDAEVGQCYGKVKIAGTYKTLQEEVVVQPESKRTEIIPAKYGFKTEEVIIKEESFKYVQIPATYKTVQEEVTIEPEKKEIVTIPAQYNTVTERVMVKPARKVWKKGRGLMEKPGEDGEIMCLKEEPAVYENVTKQVLVSPERTETKITPAVKKVISKQVVDQPARVEKVAIPAVKSAVQKKVIIEPEQTKTVDVPAVKKMVTKKVPLTEDKVEWSPIVCNDNITPELVSKIQSALALKGYNVAQDGNFGGETAQALDKFQKSIGLDSSGIALKTLQELGIN